MTATNTLGSVNASITVSTSNPIFKGYWYPSVQYNPTDLVIKAGPYDTDTSSPKIYSCLKSSAEQIAEIPFYDQEICNNSGSRNTFMFDPAIATYDVGDFVRPPLEAVGVGPEYYLPNEVLECISLIDRPGTNIVPNGAYVAGNNPAYIQYWRRMQVGNPLLFSVYSNHSTNHVFWQAVNNGADYLGTWSPTYSDGNGYIANIFTESPIDNKLYYSINATATEQPDPSVDTTNWQLVGLSAGIPKPFLIGTFEWIRGGFSFGWSGGNGATSYAFVLNGVLTVPSTDNSLTTKSVTISGLADGTLYKIAVFAINANGVFCPLSFVQYTLASVPQLTSSVSDTSFTVSWQPQPTVSSYSYTITDASGTTYTPSTDSGLTGQNIVVTGLTPSTDYFVVVTATIVASGPVASPPLTVRTIPTPVVPTALTLTVTELGSSVITVSWTGGEAATSYTYFLSSVEGNNTYSGIQDEGLSHNYVKYFGLTPNIEYTVSVIAVNSAGNTAESITATTLSDTPVNQAPSNLQASSITGTSFTVSWQPPQGVTSYSYSITNLSGGTYTPSTDNGMSAQNIGVSGLTESTQYVVVVTAINESGSVASSPLTVTTLSAASPEPAPTQPSVSTTVSSNTITATWTGGVGATSYSYSMIDASENTFTPSTMSSNTVVYSGLPPSTEFTLIVTAINFSDSG
jgi:hypothetical protein